MPTARTLRRHLTWLAFIVPLVVIFPQVAFAQEVQITPNFSQVPAHDTGGWTYKMAVGSIIVGLLVAVLFVVSYLRFAPGFSGQEEERPSPARAPVPAGGGMAVAPGAAAGVAATVAPGPAAAVPPPTAQPTTEGGPASSVAVADPPAVAPAAASAAPRPEVEPDQETFDRVLQEELDKGTDRRVAEGRAKASALRAARKKAQG